MKLPSYRRIITLSSHQLVLDLVEDGIGWFNESGSTPLTIQCRILSEMDIGYRKPNLKPNDYHILRLLSEAHYQTGEHDRAVKYAEKLILGSPKNYHALLLNLETAVDRCVCVL